MGEPSFSRAASGTATGFRLTSRCTLSGEHVFLSASQEASHTTALSALVLGAQPAQQHCDNRVEFLDDMCGMLQCSKRVLDHLFICHFLQVRSFSMKMLQRIFSRHDLWEPRLVRLQ